MRVKCDYCGNYIEETEELCPHCGAPNDRMQRSASGVPKTVGQLQGFCAAHGLPLEKMRFFIGEDCREPRAYGLYRDGEGCFVVYKNKSDGSRAVRYRGTDEAYAVNEIYQKLKSEIAQQRSYQAAKNASHGDPNRFKNPNNPYNYYPNRSVSSGAARRRRRGPRPLTLILIVFVLLCLLYGLIAKNSGKGYYHYNDAYYYLQSGSWYAYDDEFDSWYPTTADDELQSNADDYYASSYYSPDYGVESFSDSSYYDSGYSSSSGGYDYEYDDDWDDDWDDSDWDWGGDDWDSGGSDWDSDW